MEDNNKKLYNLRETEQLTEVPASTLRYWESQFEELRPRKDGHHNRYYTAEDIALIKRIRYIRDELHLTRIVAIQNELRHGTRHTDQRQRATEILLRIRKELVELRKNLYSTENAQNTENNEDTTL